jgi:hypothetical protein
MDPRTIRALADDAARKARHEGREPYGFYDDDDVDAAVRSLPFLGHYMPRGYKLVEELFVDSSGFGREDEPAMTFAAFCERVRKDVRESNPYYYAIREAGQFQVYVGVYRVTKDVPVRRPRRAVKVPHVTVPTIG